MSAVGVPKRSSIAPPAATRWSRASCLGEVLGLDIGGVLKRMFMHLPAPQSKQQSVLYGWRSANRMVHGLVRVSSLGLRLKV